MRLNGIRNLITACVLMLFVGTVPALNDMSGQQAPDFALKSMKGENLRLSEYRGDVVIINFWATWCGPCRQEMPMLDEIYQRYQKIGFSLLGVNIDDDPRRAQKMAESLGVSFPVLFDHAKEVSRMYNVDAMPVTYLIDRQGVVRHVHFGYKPGYEHKYVQELRNLLRE